jgi:hypothetical protein
VHDTKILHKKSKMCNKPPLIKRVLLFTDIPPVDVVQPKVKRVLF